MAHGLNSVLKRGPATAIGCKNEGKTGVGSRRIFAPHFKLQVLDSYRNDTDCKGNQRATARKYGIHRRQIQKWLQVENNLRNSVCKGKGSECNNVENSEKYGMEMALRMNGHRQRDDAFDGVSEAGNNIPELHVIPTALSPLEASPPVPLDFTTHSRVNQASPTDARSASSPPVPSNPEAPIDLSLKKFAAGLPSPCAPVPCCPLTPPNFPSPTSLVQFQHHPDVWDLSTNKRKYDVACDSSSSVSETPKPVKLFKPYLDDFNQDNSSSSSGEEIKLECCSNSVTSPNSNCDYYYYNHNNNICEIKAECTYTIQELRPTGGSVNYYYPVPTTYQTSSDYDSTNYCCVNYDDTYVNSVVPLKQRQTYSVDFKLSAIECYYEDSICKGNQRAVANKYNIHRRQVQKWLKQEEELRQRSDCGGKQAHAVR